MSVYWWIPPPPLMGKGVLQSAITNYLDAAVRDAQAESWLMPRDRAIKTVWRDCEWHDVDGQKQ